MSAARRHSTGSLFINYEEMSVSRKKKQHICVECGESFNHGIGLRKHQRQTGHKGSRIAEEGDDGADGGEDAPAAAEPEPAAAAPPPPPPPKADPPPPVAEPEPELEPEPEPAVAAMPTPVYDEDDDDRTVAVSRAQQAPHAQPYETAPVSRPMRPEPSSMQHTRQKIDLVGRGLKVIVSAKAKDAGQQLRQSARSGADIFTEAMKLAIALTCFLAIPTFLFFWWKSNQSHRQTVRQPAVINPEDGSLAARSTLLKYLDHLGKKELEQAYLLLSPGWRAELSAENFRDAFLDIEDVRWAVNDQRLNPNGEADVLVRLAYQEGGKTRRFLGLFRLQKGTQGWRIDRAELSPDRGT